jgi:hypothetical protein
MSFQRPELHKVLAAAASGDLAFLVGAFDLPGQGQFATNAAVDAD